MGFSKKTGKGRLDKYYYLAKEHGYRARSAFKIKQLNQKFGFLENARVLVDLCAAPGGWLQVASECMPMSHVIIGVDLVPIKPIKGVTTIVGDITTDKCRSEIRKELKNWKADVVLHDGAPNVGNAWIQDAFSQAELALHSFKLASEFLIDGGVFVTKVFRSKEYPQVLASLKKYFKKVEATKPDSSRSVSAEIFVFCKGFQPSTVKSDPIVIKEILGGPEESISGILTNILHPEKKKRNRDGYEDNVTILHKKISLSDFLNSKEPDQVLASHNEISITTHDENAFIDSMKGSSELRTFCSDLRVLGRREFKSLLKVNKLFLASCATKPVVATMESNIEGTDENEFSDSRLFDEYKSHLRAQKKREKKLAKFLGQSQNHIDLSFDQELVEPDPAEIGTDAQIADSDWFRNPIFGEVLEGFKADVPLSKPLKIITDKPALDASKEPDQETQKDSILPPVDEDDLVDMTFNRYAFDDDRASLPTWFVEDENQHNTPLEPITKEVADLLRENERLIKNRIPKKILEFKNRQKIKALRKLQSLKKKASVIAESEDIGEGQKVSQIRKLLSKAKIQRVRPKVVVSKGKLKGVKGRPRGIKGKYKMVDRRMIKDNRFKNSGHRK